ncbi:MAG TPA: folate-binding protein [Gammaproteobacteria bacterium]|nr:folate-binding protein [Gammaproteobacteria bacterium]
MNPAWQQYLRDHAGAEFADEHVVHYGNAARELRVASSGAIISDLSHLALLRARGPDAATFLQGQLTHDIHAATATHSPLAAHCSPQGRVLALLRILAREDGYGLLLPRALLEDTLARLRTYVLMAKVSLEPDPETVLIGYAAATAEATLTGLLGGCPTEDHGTLSTAAYTTVRLPGPHPRFVISGSAADIQTLWQKLDVNAAPVGAAPWRLLDILAGMPQVTPETADRFVPQMLNLDVLGAINFQKGCYTGQEVVARMRYLGKLKRRMFLLHCDADTPPGPGAALYSPALRSDEAAGTVVSAAPHPDGGSRLLAVLRLEAQDAAWRLGGINGPACQRGTLPYSWEKAAH